MFDYCIEELEIHYEALVRKKAEDTKQQASMLRTAINADRKGFRRFIKELEDTWRKIELAQGRVLSSPDSFFAGLDGVKGKNRGKQNRKRNKKGS